MPALETAVSSHPFAFPTWSTTLPIPPPATAGNASDWSPADSASLYRIDAWGSPYFAVNSNGNVSVRPHGGDTLPHQEIDLLKVVKKSTDQKTAGCLGLRLPLIVRFPDILKNRLESLQFSFDLAIKSHGYESHYQGVYPVKSNQDKHIVDDIVKYGSRFRFGLEAGSKPELLLAMSSLCNGSPDSLLVCNGFKDEEYISLALVTRKLKLNTVIVLEQEDELDFVIQVSKKLNLCPVIGIRAKLQTKHSGHFGSTSGKEGKFGLTTSQILRIVNKLKQNEMLDSLQMLHFHIGSQIPTTSLLSEGVSEAAQIYCELIRLGASMTILDIGGGLGIDYDGSKSDNSDVSVSYTLQEYASAVIRSVQNVCDQRGVKHPVLCSESGRALVSHHSVLVFEAFSTSCHDPPLLSSLQNFVTQLSGDAAVDFQELWDAAILNDYETSLVYTEQMKEKYINQFKDGLLPIEHLAAVDELYEVTSKAISRSDPVQTYNINLSVFTSIPDSWGIGQLFPIVPIHRLGEKPSVRGILSDLTCDSDGKIDKFIGGESSLPLHKLEGGERYYIGMFLGGAYQESLGGLHNLFGSASVVRLVQSNGPHGFAVTGALMGASCGDVLRVMQHEPEMMFEMLKHRVEEVEDGTGMGLINRVAWCFNNMPYLEVGDENGENGEWEEKIYGENGEWDCIV